MGRPCGTRYLDEYFELSFETPFDGSEFCRSDPVLLGTEKVVVMFNQGLTGGAPRTNGGCRNEACASM